MGGLWPAPPAAAALPLVPAWPWVRSPSPLGGLVTATSNGGLGTGNGLGGAVVAIVAGLIAIVLGALARAREREVA